MIPKGAKTNLATLTRAIANGDTCLMEVTDNVTGELVDAICAVSFDGTEFQLAPLAIMVRDNPYERFIPPTKDDRDLSLQN